MSEVVECARPVGYRGTVKDLEPGSVYGRLTVKSLSHRERSHAFYRVECVCGSLRVVRGIALTNGGTKSCGCAACDALSAPQKPEGG